MIRNLEIGLPMDPSDLTFFLAHCIRDARFQSSGSRTAKVNCVSSQERFFSQQKTIDRVWRKRALFVGTPWLHIHSFWN